MHLHSPTVTGVSAGYIATRYRLSQNLADLERSVVLRGQGRAHGSGTGPGRLHGDSGPGAIPPELVAELRAVGEKNFEAGVGGLHELEDRYATTRGDH